jgi:spermidine synthase
VASLAFPLVLLPVLGVMRTAFLMGVLNLAVASLLMVTFHRRLSRRWRRRLWVLAGSITTLLVAGTVASADVVAFFEQQLYRDRIIYRTQSAYQRIIITRDADDVRLFLDGNLQFSSRDEYRYHEMLVHPVMQAARSHESVLVLGGGDGLVARELLKYDTVQEIVIVDLDPAITELAASHPTLRDINGDALADSRVTVINQDAFNYVRDGTRRFPVVIIDLPDPNNEGLSKLYSQQFYRLLHERLSRDGVFVTQATSPYFVRRVYWSIVDTIAASGFEVVPLRAHVPSFGEWGFVVGSVTGEPRIGVPENITLRYLNPAVLATAQVFDPDTDRIEGGINTLDNPILPRFYEQGWQRWN